MASTSTNKQPLLMDHVLHAVQYTGTATNNGIDIVGTNTATILVDSTSADGAIIEDIYAISRSSTKYTLNLYLSTARDYLRPNESFFVGSFDSATTEREVTHWEEMPRCLSPVPRQGDDKYNNAFYIPRGMALWVARDDTQNVTDGPVIAAQGGWY